MPWPSEVIMDSSTGCWTQNEMRMISRAPPWCRSTVSTRAGVGRDAGIVHQLPDQRDLGLEWRDDA